MEISSSTFPVVFGPRMNTTAAIIIPNMKFEFIKLKQIYKVILDIDMIENGAKRQN